MSREEGGRRMRASARGVALLVLLVAMLVSAAYPARQLLAQHSRISALRAEESLLGTKIERLRALEARLGTDAEIERMAREQLGMIRPGETAFVIAEGPGASSASVPAASREDHRPWYRRWWDGLVRGIRSIP